MAKSAGPIQAYLSVRKFADRIAMSEKSVRRWIDAGELPAHRLGGRIRIAESDAAAYLAARRR